MADISIEEGNNPCLVTKKDLEKLQEIVRFIQKHEQTDETNIDWEKVEWLDTIRRVENNLINGLEYFKPVAPEFEKQYYDSICADCGWHGSSQYLLGGGALADTGDHADLFCPICDSRNVE